MRRFEAFAVALETLSTSETAWWAREGSNLQPDRYERRGRSEKPGRIRWLARLLMTFVAVRLRRLVGHSLVRAGGFLELASFKNRGPPRSIPFTRKRSQLYRNSVKSYVIYGAMSELLCGFFEGHRPQNHGIEHIFKLFTLIFQIHIVANLRNNN